MTRKPITPDMLEFGRYGSGELAIEVIDREGAAYPDSFPGEKLLTATVSLRPYGHPKPSFGCVWLKDWSENEGVPEALVSGGCVELTGRSVTVGVGVPAREARLLPEALKALTAQGGFLPI